MTRDRAVPVTGVRGPIIFSVACQLSPFIPFVHAQVATVGRDHDERFAHPRSVAVLDFAMKDSSDGVDSSALGVADYLTVSLQNQGVFTIERLELRHVLAERELQTGGFLKAGEIIRARLPWVRYLARGTVERLKDDGVRLTVSIADAATGVEVSEIVANRDSYEQLSFAIEELADRIARFVVGKQNAPSVGREPVPGFTSIPEVALQFYRGVDHYVSGRPAFASEYFNWAANADPSFIIAKLWRMKSYQVLGLDDFAGIVHDDIAGTTAGRALLDRLDGGKAETGPRRVTAVYFDGAVSEQGQRIANALRRQPAIQVFSPAWIRQLAAEADLSVTPDFRTHQLFSRTWLPIDVLVSVRANSADGPDAAPSVRSIDAVTGTVLYKAPLSAFEAGWPDELDQLVCPLRQRRASEERSFISRNPQPKLHDSHVKRRGRIFQRAYRLRAMCEEPRNPLTIIQCFKTLRRTQGRQVWKEYPVATLPYYDALMDRLLEALEPNDPHAARWTSYALWVKWYCGDDVSNGSWSKTKNARASIHFRPLVRTYPDTPAALAARYLIGLELLADGRVGEASSALSSIVEEFESLYGAGTRDAQWQIRANLYYFAARATSATGNTTNSRRYAHKLLSILDVEDGPITGEGSRADRLDPYCFAIVKAPWKPTRMIMPGTLLRKMDLISLGFGRRAQKFCADLLTTAPPGASVVDALYLEYTELGSSGQRRRAYEVAQEYIRAITRALRAGDPVDPVHLGFRLFSFAQIASGAISSGQARVNQDLINELIDALRAAKNAYPTRDDVLLYLMYSVGRYDDIVEHAEGRLAAAKDPTEKRIALSMKARALSLGGRHRESAELLEREVIALESDLPRGRRRGIELFYQCVGGFERAGDFDRAARVLERRLRAYEDSLPIAVERSGADRPLRPALASELAYLKYHLARMAIKLGNHHRAITLLKEAIEISDGRELSLHVDHGDVGFDYYQGGGSSTSHGEVFGRSVKLLETLREEALSDDP